MATVTVPVQRCQRCGVETTVHTRAMPWCPRCGGVLTAPVAAGPWTTRWVAHPPPGALPPQTAPPPQPGPTPTYGGVPQWGLPTRAWQHPLELVAAAEPNPRQRAVRLAGLARLPVFGTAVAASFAAVAEAWRYGLVVRGRTELLSAKTVAISDALVVATGVLTPVLAVLSAVLAAGWLVRARQAAHAARGRTDTRTVRGVLVGALFPVLNLGQAGVLLTELERALPSDDRARRPSPSSLVRWWWTGWVASAGLAALTWVWRRQGTVQAQADAIVLAGAADLAVVVTAVLTLFVLRRCTEALAGTARVPRRRWVASVSATAPTRGAPGTMVR